MKNIIILGHTGLLGRYVLHYLKSDTNINTICLKDFNVISMSQEDIFDRLKVYNPVCVVNCIGIVRQRQDVSDENTIIVNAYFPYLLLQTCNRLGSKMIHISTDCVFDGKVGNYNEKSETSAYDIYGKSKVMGEAIEASIIRASFIGEELNRKLSLLEWVIKQSGKECNGFNNQMWNGITALTLAKIIHKIICESLYWNGIRHVFSPISCSKYELINIINEAYYLNVIVKEASSDIYANRILTTVYPEFLSVFGIPSIKEQLIELKNFDINNRGV